MRKEGKEGEESRLVKEEASSDEEGRVDRDWIRGCGVVELGEDWI